jgi:hypothetical protein
MKWKWTHPSSCSDNMNLKADRLLFSVERYSEIQCEPVCYRTAQGNLYDA